MKPAWLLLLGSILGTALSCGGGADPTQPARYASQLVYTEPSTSGWRFTKVGGSGSTADPLVLELRGTAGERVKGVAFFLDLGATSKASWAPLGTNTHVAPASAMTLGADPRLLAEKLSGNELQVGIAQKTGDADPSQGIVRVALALKDGQTAGVIGVTQDTQKAAVLQADGTLVTPVTILLGTLEAQ